MNCYRFVTTGVVAREVPMPGVTRRCRVSHHLPRRSPWWEATESGRVSIRPMGPGGARSGHGETVISSRSGGGAVLAPGNRYPRRRPPGRSLRGEALRSRHRRWHRAPVLPGERRMRGPAAGASGPRIGPGSAIHLAAGSGRRQLSPACADRPPYPRRFPALKHRPTPLRPLNPRHAQPRRARPWQNPLRPPPGQRRRR